MENLKYVGETLWIGQVGSFAIILGFCAALVSAISYFLAFEKTDDSWKKIGRWSFLLHSFCVVFVMGLIFYAMHQHKYEYSYVFDHVNDSLPMQYIFSAFWEGQEGSFLLWMFWHLFIGIILIVKKENGKLHW